MQSEVQILKNIFISNNIPVSIEWLEECISWCKREILNSNYTTDHLKDATHEQWLLLDLREIESPVLPTGLSEKKFMLLNGNFSLQLMQVVDISKPKYWQLQQIRKENVLTRPPRSETNDSVGTGKRVLQLTLTDGVQYVEAMEYKPISLLNINLTPGIKVRLSGPITIRRGRLMLQEENIRILGGEVENILVTNAAENILAKALKLPENPNPQVVDVNLITVGQEDDNIQDRVNIQTVTKSKNQQNIVTTSRNVHNNNGESERIAGINTVQSSSHGTGSASKIQIDDYPTDEDFEMLMEAENLLNRNENKSSARNQQISASAGYISTSNKFMDPYDEEIEMLMEVEKELENNDQNDKGKTINRTPDIFEDDFNTDQIDELIEMTNKIDSKILSHGIDRGKTVQMGNSASIKSRAMGQNDFLPTSKSLEAKNPNAKLFDEFFDEEHLFSNLDFDDPKTTNMSVNTTEIISITKLLQLVQHTSNKCFKIKAKFKSIVEKLTLEKQEYKLTIMIQDESNEAICRVHSDIVSKWAGLTPSEIMDLKRNISSQDFESKKKVERALQSIKDLLLDVNHEMEIQINGKDTVPIIKNIFY